MNKFNWLERRRQKKKSEGESKKCESVCTCVEKRQESRSARGGTVFFKKLIVTIAPALLYLSGVLLETEANKQDLHETSPPIVENPYIPL